MRSKLMSEHFIFDGCDTVELAKTYQTPLYVFSETKIIEACRELREDFVEKYERVRVAYASKAFNTLAMLRLVEREGLCLDVVSGGELYTAIKADFEAEKIEFNGNNKSIEELEMALDYGVGRIIVDGLQELQLIQALCKEKQKTAKILFRITPEISVHTHEYISTGQKDSKFGIPLDETILLPLIKEAIDAPEIDFYGIHFHIGSQLAENQTHLAAAQVALDLVKKIHDTLGYTVKELNYGGGFGVRYTKDDIRQPFSYFLHPLMEKTIAFCQQHNLYRPTIVIEPGRSIVAEAGISLHTIGAIKTLPGIRTYASIDGGMTDNIRPGLYHAQYEGCIANKYQQPASEVVTISGKICESTDILMKDVQLPPVETGDIFATFTTGAYGYSMASNYNKIQIPAAVFVKEGRAALVVERQSYAQVIQNERIPSHLQ
ncbi:diaminopimelate decarboxylase [Enterococcus bulliens]